MAEIEAVRGTNGFTVVSTFSGAGGSCLGYEMAGFKLLWANEFTEQSARIFRLNHNPDCHLDTRDIRTIQPGEILEQIGKAPGEVDIFDGSPPCDSFSMAGRRDKKWGQVKAYSGRKQGQRTDDLFFEYIRLMRGIQPKVFVAENVAGLVRGRAKGKFKAIMAAFRECGYTVSAALLDARWLGVPQTRQRTIIIGTAAHLKTSPCFPSPDRFGFSMGDACPWLSDGRHYLQVGEKHHTQKPGNSFPRGEIFKMGKPSPCIQAASLGGTTKAAVYICNNDGKRRLKIREIRRFSSFPDDFKMPGSYHDQWRAIGMSVPPLMMRAIAETIRDRILIPTKQAK